MVMTQADRSPTRMARDAKSPNGLPRGALRCFALASVRMIYHESRQLRLQIASSATISVQPRPSKQFRCMQK